MPRTRWRAEISRQTTRASRPARWGLSTSRATIYFSASPTCLPKTTSTNLISKMLRQAFTMKLKPGFAAEYKKRHDELWPELAKELRTAGISDFSIFLDEKTLTLFAVRKISDEKKFAELSKQPIIRKWWTYMAPLMDVNPDLSPVEFPLKEVFYLE